jgi:hypothetical protein
MAGRASGAPLARLRVKRRLLLSRRECPDGSSALLATKHETQLLRRTQTFRMIGPEGRARLWAGQRAEEVATEVAILTARLTGSASRHGDPSGFLLDDDRGHQTRDPQRPQVGFPQMPKKTILVAEKPCKAASFFVGARKRTPYANYGARRLRAAPATVARQPPMLRSTSAGGGDLGSAAARRRGATPGVRGRCEASRGRESQAYDVNN